MTSPTSCLGCSAIESCYHHRCCCGSSPNPRTILALSRRSLTRLTSRQHFSALRPASTHTRIARPQRTDGVSLRGRGEHMGRGQMCAGWALGRRHGTHWRVVILDDTIHCFVARASYRVFSCQVLCRSFFFSQITTR